MIKENKITDFNYDNIKQADTDVRRTPSPVLNKTNQNYIFHGAYNTKRDKIFVTNYMRKYVIQKDNLDILSHDVDQVEP